MANNRIVLLAIVELETLDVGVAPTPEKERLAPSDRMGADDRVVGTWGLPRIAHLGKSAPQLAGAVPAPVMSAEPPFDPAPQLVGQGLVGEIHVGKARVATRRRHLE